VGYVGLPPPNTTFSVKNPPPEIRQGEGAVLTDGTIELTVFDCMETMVVRYFPVDRKTRRYQGGVAGAMPAMKEAQECVHHARINPLSDDGRTMAYGQDVVARFLLSMNLGEGEDPWKFHLSEANQQRRQKVAHAFELLDEFMMMEGPLAVFETKDRKVFV